MKKTKKNTTTPKISPKTIIKIVLALVFLAGVIWGIKYSLNQYSAQQAELGIVVCDDLKKACIKTLHIHSDIIFDLCGETTTLPRESGPLSGLHTHKEKNYLHFHDELKLDYATQDQLPDKRLSIQEVMDIFELNPQEFCGRTDVQIEALVNGQPAPLDYNWQDGDDIKLIFK